MDSQQFFQDAEKKKKSIGLIHRVYLTFLKNSRNYLACTKTKSEVRGGGRKPWKQKGTGRARAGSNRSPLWRGGGVIFGPKPKIVEKKVNKKEKRLAILSALYLKKSKTVTIEQNLFDNVQIVKTKNILQLLKDLNLLQAKKVLFILPKHNRNFWLATRNLKNIQITTATSLNISELLEAENILLSNLSSDIISQTYGKKTNESY
jgi:large subunit ribosomal protein L4